MFWIGQKVVCVDDSPSDDPRCGPGGDWVPNYPKRGQIYTVRGISNTGSIVLDEIMNPIREFLGGDAEAHWKPHRFRPLVEKSTDTGMAILREILDRETVTDKPRKPVRA